MAMRISRRAVAWIALLGIVLALVFMQLRRGDAPAANPEGDASHGPIDRGSESVSERTTVRTTSSASADAGEELDGACVQTIRDAKVFASTERDAANRVQDPELEETRTVAELSKLQSNSSSSSDPEHYLTAYLKDSSERRGSGVPLDHSKLLGLGDRAIQSGSKVLAWHALLACVDAKQLCPITHLEQRLLDVDRQNAEAWALVAALKYERGDVAGALAALRGAARAPTSTFYWTETMALNERSLAAQTSIPYPDLPMNAMALASAAPLGTSPSNMCKAESASSRAWGEACLAFAALRGERNETDLARLVAYSIRDQVLTARGETDRAAEVEAEQALFRAERRSEGWMLTLSLMGSDPARFHSFLDAVQEFGESGGTRMFLRREMPSLLERAGMLDRDGARECAAQLFAPPVAGTRPATAERRVQIGDMLLISLRGQVLAGTQAGRVGPDGKISMSRVPRVSAVGKTTEELQREIVALRSAREPSADVRVILIPQRTREELRLEFDNASRELAERRKQDRQ